VATVGNEDARRGRVGSQPLDRGVVFEHAFLCTVEAVE